MEGRREGGCISWVTAISRNMPLASLSTFGIRRERGREEGKRKNSAGNFLRRELQLRCRWNGRRGGWMADAGCCMMERNSRRKKERLISRRLFLGVSLKGVFMRSLWSLV